MTEPAWVIARRVKFLHPDGREREGRIAVSAPVEEPDQWSCDALIENLSPLSITLHGADAFQTVTVALQFLAWELLAFTERGGRVTNTDGEDIDLPSIFGKLWAPP
jgi:hypothetical protein